MKYYVIINKYKMYHNNDRRYRTCTECRQRFIEGEEPEIRENFPFLAAGAAMLGVVAVQGITDSIVKGKTEREKEKQRTKQMEAIMGTDLSTKFDPSVCPPPITPQPIRTSQMRIQAASALMSDYSDQCPAPQVPSSMDRKSAVESLAETMGLTECSATKCSHDDRGGKAGAEGMFKENDGSLTEGSSVIGCSEMLMLEEKIRNITQNISCTINRQSNTTNVSVYAGNKISIRASGGSTINFNCGGELKFNQSINLKLVVVSKMTTQQTNDIQSTVNNSVHDIAKYLEKSVSNIPPETVTGRREFINKMQDIQKMDYSQDVMDILNNFSVAVNNNNDIEIVAENGSTINLRGDSCNFDQNIIINILAHNIVDTVASKAFKGSFDNVTYSERDTEVDRETKVQERTVRDRSETPVKQSPVVNKTGDIINIVLSILFFILLIGIGIFAYKKMTQNKSMMNNFPPQFPPQQ